MEYKNIHCCFFFRLNMKQTIIPPETKIEETRLRIIPSISETVDGRVIK